MPERMNDFKVPAGFPGRPEGWVSEVETFKAADKKTLLFEILHHEEPWSSPRAIFLIHGFGDHAGRYTHFTHYLKNDVGAIQSYDQRGHGRSEGLRGHVQSFQELVDDAEIALQRLHQKLQARFQKSEIHLFAHSMGGHVGIRLLAQKKNLPLQSAIISAPFLGVSQPVPAIKKLAAKALLHIWNDLQISTGLDASQISRDPAVVQFYLKDRLVHSKMTSKMWNTLLETMEDTLTKIRELPLPVLFIVPQKDGLVDSKKSLQFYEHLKAPHKELLKLPEHFHESFNDVNKETVFEAVKKWIQKNARV